MCHTHTHTIPYYRVGQKTGLFLEVCEFKMICMQNMNVIAKISCCFERSVVTLKLRKEYLNTVTHNTPDTIQIRYQQFDI